MSNVWADQTISSRTELLVLLTLADFANNDGYCWPSIETIAKQSRTSQRGVQDVISGLKLAKKIDVKIGEGPKGTNLYRVIVGGCSGCGVQIADENSAGNSVGQLHPIHQDPSGTIIEPSGKEGGTGAKTEKPEKSPLPEEAVHWNAFDDLPKVRSFTSSRKRHLSNRLKDPFWVENFRAAVQRVRSSAFCMGSNDRGWRADFDFMLQPDSVAKIMEGKYDNRPPLRSGPVHRPESNQLEERLSTPLMKL